MIIPRFAAFLFASVTLLAVDAAAQQYASSSNSLVLMWIQGETDYIAGEVTQVQRVGSHRLLAYSHEIVSPRDSASGLPTGKRQHSPFRIVKLINRASPLLLQALAKNELLREVKLDLYTLGFTGPEIRMLTYTLTNARVVSIRPWMPNKSDAATAGYPPAEEVAFTYEKITVTYQNEGLVGEDEWSTGNSQAP